MRSCNIVGDIDNEVEDYNVAKGRGDVFQRKKFRSPFDFVTNKELFLFIQLSQFKLEVTPPYIVGPTFTSHTSRVF